MNCKHRNRGNSTDCIYILGCEICKLCKYGYKQLTKHYLFLVHFRRLGSIALDTQTPQHAVSQLDQILIVNFLLFAIPLAGSIPSVVIFNIAFEMLLMHARRIAVQNVGAIATRRRVKIQMRIERLLRAPVAMVSLIAIVVAVAIIERIIATAQMRGD